MSGDRLEWEDIQPLLRQTSLNINPITLIASEKKCRQRYNCWSRGTTNVLITMAVIAVNLCIKLCFVCVQEPKKAYFLDKPRICVATERNLFEGPVWLARASLKLIIHLAT